MTDIVEKLRTLQNGKQVFSSSYQEACRDAADEIEHLRNVAQAVPKAECEYCRKWHDPRLACPEYASLSSAQCGGK
jgi:hypothetical protein